MADLNIQEIWQLLDDIKDPEIPVVSIVEMGMVRDVRVDGQKVTVSLSPTFAGCPALRVIQEEVTRSLLEAGVGDADVRITISPSWSSEAITPQARNKMKKIGLAPPPHHQGSIELALMEPVSCPYCSSTNTSLKNDFGSSLCRAIYFCYNCQQPFEQFKPL